ncbi:MAG: hypothetical protein JXA97_14290 [Anaerolineales bacterium]|nr:hypothetical protein [Anaerolineales bacterium]
MNKALRRSHILSTSSGFLASAGFLYNFILLILLYPRVSQFKPISTRWEQAGILFGACLFILAVFHALAVLTLVFAAIKRRETSWRSAGAIVIGVISGILILADIAMLQDIGNQYALGWDSRGEWIILFISQAFHALFILLALPLLITRLRSHQPQVEEPAVKDDTLFQLAHTTGALCGGLGSAACAAAIAFKLPAWIVDQTILSLGTLLLSPYLLVLALWLYLHRKKALIDWVDEKQLQDVSRAALHSLLWVIPTMTVLFVLQTQLPEGNIWALLWFPAYIFLTLTILSTNTLYLSRH